MPILSSPRHERFAQERAKGRSLTEAYLCAGYAGDSGAASRLAKNVRICQRVAELQEQMASLTVENVSITRASVISELGKLGFTSVPESEVKASDKRAALLNLAQIEGWVVEKHEHTGKDGAAIKFDMSGLSDEQLAQLETIFGAVAGVAHDRGRSGGDTAKGSAS